MKKIISLTVAILFLVNNLSYALNVQPGSLDPIKRQEMYAKAQQLWREKAGPGGTWLDEFLSKMSGQHSIEEKPESSVELNLDNWYDKFNGEALVLAIGIMGNILEKVEKLDQLIGQKAVTELTEQDLAEIQRVLNSPWVTNKEFNEMAEEAGDEGALFCWKIRSEARLPFEMIVAIRRSAKDLSSRELEMLFSKTFEKIKSEKLTLDFVGEAIVKIFTRLSNEENPSINGESLEQLLWRELSWAKREVSPFGDHHQWFMEQYEKIQARIKKIMEQKKYWKTVEEDVKEAIKDGKVVKISQDTQPDGAVIGDKEKLVNRIGKEVLKKYDISEDMAKLYENDLRGQNLEAGG